MSNFRVFFFFQAEDGIRDVAVTGVQTCALPISCVALLSCLRAAPACAKSAHVRFIGPPGATAPAGFRHQLAPCPRSAAAPSGLRPDRNQKIEPGLPSTGPLGLRRARFLWRWMRE